jgi:hypothetical protein
VTRHRLRDLDVRELSFVDRAAVRSADDETQPMRFLLWKAENDSIEKSAMSTAARNALPDSAFAWVEGSGDKKVRRYPYKRADGSIDLPHLRNALARCAQSETECPPAVKARLQAAARSAGIGAANNSEEVPEVDLQEALAVIAKAGGKLNKSEGGEEPAAGESGQEVLSNLLKDESMPTEVRNYLESVETRLSALTKNEGSSSNLRSLDQDGEMVRILKEQGILPAVREMVAKEQERARGLEAELERLRIEKAEGEVRTELAKAEEFVGGLPYLGISEDARSQIAKALFVLRREDSTAAGELEKVLKANNTRMQTSALWSELGIAGQSTSGHGSARAELQSRAVELRKSEGGKGKTLEQIKADILVEDADLAQRLDEEGIEAP